MALSAEPIVLVHGGAGSITDAQLPVALHGVKTAARVGFETLKCGGSVLDAVQQAVRSMEINPQFNAGYGSVLTWEGKVEMDAAIMNGDDLNAGCVSVPRRRDTCSFRAKVQCFSQRKRISKFYPKALWSRINHRKHLKTIRIV
uniref:Putative L-asparaginase GA20639 n=1 Tax=Bactrocera latifrons TaxID=174628 RepID=A0A0K8UVR8_BACLA